MSRVRPYLQLVRLPNLFTAGADGLAGWLLAGGALGELRGWLPAVGAGVAIYAGGVVLNDVFDLEVDRSERPNRPLPSGRVGLGFARGLGSIALVAGLGSAAATGSVPAVGLAAAVVACVLGYDLGLKTTPLGPWVMGSCRGLNLLLGAAAAGGAGVVWPAAALYALFVAGITWVSRSEVGDGPRRNVVLGATLEAVALAGFAGLAAAGTSWFGASGGGSATRVLGLSVLAVAAGVVARRTAVAVRRPSPGTIQGAVKAAIFSLVWLHVGLVAAVRGPAEAAAVAAWWFPAVLAGRWLYAT